MLRSRPEQKETDQPARSRQSSVSFTTGNTIIDSLDFVGEVVRYVCFLGTFYLNHSVNMPDLHSESKGKELCG